MKPELIENGMVTLRSKRHTITLDEPSWRAILAQAHGPGGPAWARKTAFERVRQIATSPHLTAEEKRLSVADAYQLHLTRYIAALRASQAAAEALLHARIKLSIQHDCPAWRITNDLELIPDTALTPAQKYALAHDCDPTEVEICTDCQIALGPVESVSGWRELFGDRVSNCLLPEYPNQTASASEALCEACWTKHAAELARLESEQASDRARGELISAGYEIRNGSGWNHHRSAAGLKTEIFEGRAPAVPAGKRVIGAPIDREKPFGYRFAIIEPIPADQLDEAGEHPDADEWCSPRHGRPCRCLETYRVDSGTNDETAPVMAWLEDNL